jgi:hypothetical protein
MDVDELDEATRQILMKATIHPEYGTRLRCTGELGGLPCPDQLYQCVQCRRVGCRTAGCSQHVYEGNGCRHCGHFAGMNRNVKVTAVRLMELWHKLHGDRLDRA